MGARKRLTRIVLADASPFISPAAVGGGRAIHFDKAVKAPSTTTTMPPQPDREAQFDRAEFGTQRVDLGPDRHGRVAKIATGHRFCRLVSIAHRL